MPVISVQYDLRPPAGVTSTTLIPAKSHEFPVGGQSVVEENHGAFYDNLRKAIEEAKTTLGEELTQWRDAVGKAETEKEKKKAIADDDEDEDMDEVDDKDAQ